MQAADARRWFPELEALREMMTWAQNDELLTRVIDVPRLAAAIDARSLTAERGPTGQIGRSAR